ncbi:MAG TPA: metallophosphoesterase family protein [Candidatus Dormibacteraeota bacterium]|nr:metallophosphoesterase family protein [Candidatus Dormibacteraeota bacterium]
MGTLVGVVADTHCPEFIERLPDQLFEALQGAQLILHAGDVNGSSTLDELGRIAPVEAVRGDHDRSLTSLPEVRELNIEGKRVVLVHGNRSRWTEEPQTLLWTLSLGFFRPHQDLPRSLRRRFPDADVIVFGHTHWRCTQIVDGALLFNPGGVHQWTHAATTRRLTQNPGWFEWCWLQLARHLRRIDRPSVGILEIDPVGGVQPKIIDL